MGIISNIYTSIDKKVGGVLPGGYTKPSTPTQSKPSTPTQSKSTQQSTSLSSALAPYQTTTVGTKTITTPQPQQPKPTQSKVSGGNGGSRPASTSVLSNALAPYQSFNVGSKNVDTTDVKSSSVTTTNKLTQAVTPYQSFNIGNRNVNTASIAYTESSKKKNIFETDRPNPYTLENLKGTVDLPGGNKGTGKGFFYTAVSYPFLRVGDIGANIYTNFGGKDFQVPVSGEEFIGSYIFSAGLGPLTATSGEIAKTLPKTTGVIFKGSKQTLNNDMVETYIKFLTNTGDEGYAKSMTQLIYNQFDENFLTKTLTVGRQGKGEFVGIGVGSVKPKQIPLTLNKEYGITIPKEGYVQGSVGSVAYNPKGPITSNVWDSVLEGFTPSVSKSTKITGYRSADIGINLDEGVLSYGKSTSKFGKTYSMGYTKEIPLIENGIDGINTGVNQIMSKGDSAVLKSILKSQAKATISTAMQKPIIQPIKSGGKINNLLSAVFAPNRFGQGYPTYVGGTGGNNIQSSSLMSNKYHSGYGNIDLSGFKGNYQPSAFNVPQQKNQFQQLNIDFNKPNQRQFPGLDQPVKNSQKQFYGTNQGSGSLVTPKLNNPTPTITKTYNPKNPKIPYFSVPLLPRSNNSFKTPGFFNLPNIGSPQGKRGRKAGRQPKNRIPSLVSSIYGIKAPSASKYESTGFVTRPILSSPKRRK